jgi:hypothetical protein
VAMAMSIFPRSPSLIVDLFLVLMPRR